MSFLRYSPLFLIFLAIVVVQKSDWSWSWPKRSQPELLCQKIILPPLKKEETGFLRKIPAPYTKPGDMLGLKAEFYEVTAYAVGDAFTPGSITADGREVRPGITAACPESMPLGTPIYIEYLGVRICEDRGYLGDQRIDVAFPSVESALIFGRQRLAVVIIR